MFQGVQNIVTKNPEKSRDFSFKNPGILADLNPGNPGIPGIPLGPGGEQRPKKETKLKTGLAAAALIICGAVP